MEKENQKGHAEGALRAFLAMILHWQKNPTSEKTRQEILQVQQRLAHFRDMAGPSQAGMSALLKDFSAKDLDLVRLLVKEGAQLKKKMAAPQQERAIVPQRIKKHHKSFV